MTNLSKQMAHAISASIINFAKFEFEYAISETITIDTHQANYAHFEPNLIKWFISAAVTWLCRQD